MRQSLAERGWDHMMHRNLSSATTWSVELICGVVLGLAIIVPVVVLLIVCPEGSLAVIDRFRTRS